MSNLLPDRTPPVIAAEINAIKHQTGKIILAGAIEIGRRLKEVKEMLPHGEWGKWLEESVSYSQKTAERLMKIFEAYGAQPQASLDTGTQAQGQALPNLNYSQALKDLNAANLKARVNKITLLYESLDRAFKDLTWEIKNLAADDPEAYKVYRKRVKDFLSRCSNQNI